MSICSRLALVFCLCLVSYVVAAQTYLPLTGAGKKPIVAGGAVSFVQNAAAINGGQAQTRAVTLTGTVAGNLVIVGIGWCDDASCATALGTTISSVTSSNSGSGETCAQATGAYIDNVFSADIWYCKNIVGGSDTITVTTSSATNSYYIQASGSELHGASTTVPFDAVANHTQATSGTSYSVSTNGSTASSSEFIYSAGFVGGSVTVTFGQTPIQGNFDQYQVSSTPGTYTNTATWTGSHGYSIGLAAFKP